MYNQARLFPDLFHKCILQSGYALSTWSFCEHPVERAFELGAMLGYRGIDKQELLDFLKQTPANELIEATRALKAELRKVRLHLHMNESRTR